MKVIHLVSELRQWRKEVGSGRVVLVPTMGALHEGHLKLIEVARELAGPKGQVGVSIFVNPLQFGPNEDFGRYPRELEADCARCESAAADVVFAPSVDEVYPKDRSVIILETSLSKVLCGASRPGHFDGVGTVVAKLFNYFTPDDAVFGTKDYQQLAIIRRMVRDLNFPLAIHGVDTVREPDGLAMSSRNRYLSTNERSEAPALRGALQLIREAFHAGETSAATLRGLALNHLSANAPSGALDYLELVDAENLQPVAEVNSHTVVAVAYRFSKARLIDNLELA
ncbi:MAG: pantoate--beta-alanine ligase [Verrucomicrobiaceae bacterium]|nr:pantoate--beta-alanine ligase [Verrucomicrobiaceae bacterium]